LVTQMLHPSTKLVHLFQRSHMLPQFQLRDGIT